MMKLRKDKEYLKMKS